MEEIPIERAVEGKFSVKSRVSRKWIGLREVEETFTCKIYLEYDKLTAPGWMYFKDNSLLSASPIEDDEGSEEEEDPSRHYVLSVPHEKAVEVVIAMEGRSEMDQNSGSFNVVKLYHVDGEDYARCDDPIVFWTEEYRMDSVRLKYEGPCCIVAVLDPEKVYMLLPEVQQPLEFTMEIFASSQIQVDVLVEDETDEEGELSGY